MEKLIIAANLGRVRVLRWKKPGDDPIEQPHLVEQSSESVAQHVASVRETVTDQAGRFPQGNGVGHLTGMSYGEEHHLKEEIERVALGRTAVRIDDIVGHEGHPPWILAAPQSIVARLEQCLAPRTRSTLDHTVGSDLTRCPLSEMENRFA
jgi:hypothetical protein